MAGDTWRSRGVLRPGLGWRGNRPVSGAAGVTCRAANRSVGGRAGTGRRRTREKRTRAKRAPRRTRCRVALLETRRRRRRRRLLVLTTSYTMCVQRAASEHGNQSASSYNITGPIITRILLLLLLLCVLCRTATRRRVMMTDGRITEISLCAGPVDRVAAAAGLRSRPSGGRRGLDSGIYESRVFHKPEFEKTYY